MDKPIKKTIPFSLKQLGELDEYYIVEGLASTFGNVDRQGDIIAPNAFDGTISRLKAEALRVDNKIEGTEYSALLPALFNHDTDKPVGSYVDLEVRSDGLRVVALLPKLDTNVSGIVVPQLRVKSIGSMSIGGFIREIDPDRDSNIRTITEFELFEISLVVMPANVQAVITSVKSQDLDSLLTKKVLSMAPVSLEWSQEQAVERVKAITESTVKLSFCRDIKKDLSNDITESFLFADVIDGDIKVIPQAMFSSAVKIELIEPGLLTEKEVQSVKDSISIMYKQMGRSDPFTYGFSKAELKVANLSELMLLFKKGIKLSNQGADYIVSSLSNIKSLATETPHEQNSLASETTHRQEGLTKETATKLTNLINDMLSK